MTVPKLLRKKWREFNFRKKYKLFEYGKVMLPNLSDESFIFIFLDLDNVLVSVLSNSKTGRFMFGSLKYKD